MMMRPKRIHVLFFLIGCCFILYLILSSRLNEPSLNAEYMKWKHVDKKLSQMENELRKNQEVVSKMKVLINDLKEVSTTSHKMQIEEKKMPTGPKVVGDEPPRMVTRLSKLAKFDTSMCPLKKNVVPKTDIQMLSMYQKMMFDDKDGGVWKQGWDIEYNEQQWNSKNVLKVFIVPHSHNDPGWIRTFEEYYKVRTLYIFQNIVSKLQEHPSLKFIWAEISFLSLWWKMHATVPEKEAVKSLLKSGQLEIVTGGWVMNDEANCHWLSVVQQLTAGHQWLIDNLDYRPKNAWSIDPFGHSSSQPYLLKLAGLQNSVIQRVHYRVKKELALNRDLEFQWRQLWDSNGKTDMFTHMMPFYSYDVPHSCGPDPKICCQFDFKRLPGNGISCPWAAEPKKIIHKNANERASLIVDQWRKKSQLYKSNAILFPLGDDFRWNTPAEFDLQFKNYEALIDYINNKESLYTRVQFGTLEDYFKAVHEELESRDFPVLSGDFFTYSDRQQQYWSGYFTSRPFYKSMDRVLLGYLRSAETILGQAWSVVSPIKAVQLRDLVNSSRQSLALFQHHDGITGTAKDFVVNDYSDRLLDGILHCQTAIQQAAYFLLKQPQVLEQSHNDVYFHFDDLWQKRDQIPSRITIALDVISPTKRIVLYNSLLFKRQEVLTVFLTTSNVEVYDGTGEPIMAQISPVITGEGKLSVASGKYQLSFLVTVEPLSLAVYTVKLRDTDKLNKYTSFAKIRQYNGSFWDASLPSVFHVQPSALLTDNITLQAGNSTRVVVSARGYVQALVGVGGLVHPVHMDFMRYGSQQGPDNRSGAYLFMPPGPAAVLATEPRPVMLVAEGPVVSSLYVTHSQRALYDIIVKITVYNNPSLPVTSVDITNTFLISKWTHDDFELAMRLSTSVANGDVFYTDLNGMQMIKRQYFDKLPIQANFYPLPSAAYIEDEKTRLTVLTSSPLGVAALQPGQIEIMHDRRLLGDDNRGLQQQVVDNVRTRHTFRIIIENSTPCQNSPADLPSGQLTLAAHVAQQTKLQPLVSMQYTDASTDLRGPSFTPLHNLTKPIGADVVLASFVANLKPKGFGMTFQRVNLDECHENKIVNDNYPLGNGQIYIPDLVPVLPGQVFESTLTYNRINKKPLPNAVLNICPMEVKSVFLKHTDP